MKKIFVRIKDFVKTHKDEQGFKYTVIIVVLIIAAIVASEWRKWQDSKEFPPTEIVEEAPVEEDKPDILQKIWDDSKAHFIVFGGLAITLFIVKCRNETKLEESGGKIKK
ncbi:hypothetical protein [Huintestinicola sp.]